MAHNFKITNGNYYVSIDGSDSNTGTSPDTPKRTLQSALNALSGNSGTVVVGSGHYLESLSVSIGSGTPTWNILGDGLVIFDGSGNKNFLITHPRNGNISLISNIIFKNYVTFRYYVNTGNASTDSWNFTSCSFINIETITWLANTANINSQFTNCIFIASYIEASIANTANLTRCIYINSTSSSLTAVNSCFIQSVITCRSTITSFNNNNIRSGVRVSTPSTVTSGVIQDLYGRYYDLSITTNTGIGAINDPFGRPATSGAAFDFTNHRIAYPALNTGSFNLDPKFNDIEAQDFTLQADSPHIEAGGNTNIGGTNIAIRDAADGDVFNTNAVSVSNLILSGRSYIINGGVTGEVIGAPRQISTPFPKVILRISYSGLLDFSKSVTPPVVGNRNVPDQETYTSTVHTPSPDVQGANPDRLVYYMRFSTQVTVPLVDAEWDNGELWTAGNYEAFEWGTKPSVDLSGRGNGHVLYSDGGSPVYLSATWIQVKVKLRNDYI